MNIVAGYVSSVFQDFETYLRTEVDLIEDDINLVLDKYKSSFSTYELEPGIYILKIFSKLFLTFLNLSIQNLVTQLLLNLMILPGKVKWL